MGNIMVLDFIGIYKTSNSDRFWKARGDVAKFMQVYNFDSWNLFSSRIKHNIIMEVSGVKFITLIHYDVCLKLRNRIRPAFIISCCCA